MGKRNEPKIMPLEWEEHGDDEFAADTIIGRYFWLTDDEGPRLLYSYVSGDTLFHGVLATGVTLEEAMPIAQANFNAAILSAIAKA